MEVEERHIGYQHSGMVEQAWQERDEDVLIWDLLSLSVVCQHSVLKGEIRHSVLCRSTANAF